MLKLIPNDIRQKKNLPLTPSKRGNQDRITLWREKGEVEV